MPFTVSHAVLAPIIHKITGNKLPISALAIGCMVPDLFRLFTDKVTDETHLWSALIYPNLLIGLGFCCVWYFIIRPSVFRFINISHPIKFEDPQAFILFLIYVIISIIIGTSTHIIWDGLTHLDARTFAFHQVLALNMSVLGHSFPVHLILQILSSILTLPILGWMSLKYYRHHKSNLIRPTAIKLFAYSLFALAILAGIYGYIHFASPYNFEPWDDLYSYLGKSINYFFRGFLMALTLGCLIFQILEQLNIFDDQS